MATWADLDKELEKWRACGRRPGFWWRDDDLTGPTRALDRLLGIAARRRVPLHLAVIPARIAPDLARRLASEPEAWVMQHGLAHINHEPKGRGASEVGESRSVSQKLQDLRSGWARLLAARLPRTLPAFAAPWNRISDDAVAVMPDVGYRILSTSHARQQAFAAPGLRQVNIHLDPTRWKGGAAFRGEERSLEILVTHLRQRRTGEVDADEPTGLLTHHLQTDEPTWNFVEALIDRLTHAEAGRWERLDDMIPAEVA